MNPILRWISTTIPFFSTENSPEYIKRTKTPYRHPTVTYHEIQAAIPSHMHARPLLAGLWLVGRDYLQVAFFIYSALHFDTISNAAGQLAAGTDSGTTYSIVKYGLKSFLWASYWFLMGITGAGIWFNGHESGHGSVSEYNWLNDCIGLFVHSSVLNPYFAWKFSHKMHHKGSAHMEKEENYVPITRTQYLGDHPEVADKLYPVTTSDHALVMQQAEEREKATGSRFSIVYDALEDVPLVALWARFIALSTFGWNGYIMFNVNGNRLYHDGTNHLDPRSPLFKEHQVPFILLSDAMLLIFLYVFYSLGQIYGAWNLFVFWGIPYLATNFFLTWITVLQHIDSTVPHFRGSEWTYFIGNLSTVDRPFLGWMGRFFVHNASHNHIGHHLFPSMPCTTLPAATEIFAPMLGDNYVYDSSPTLWAFWRAFHECQFVEDDGGILFYRDRVGKARRGIAPELLDAQRTITASAIKPKAD